jgi:hypothetical protein
VGGSDWNNADPVTAMATQGGGIYLFEDAMPVAGDYEWKAVVTGSWDSISWDARSINTANMAFNVPNDGDTLKLYVDALVGRVKVEVQPGFCRGDANCDGAVNFDDIDAFVAALANPDSACIFENCDVNGDGSINFDDIDQFVVALSTGECQ